MYAVLTQAVGFVGLAAFVLSFQCKNNKYLILLSLFANLCYTAQFFMLGGYTASVSELISVLNCLVQSAYGRKWADWYGWRWVFSGLHIAALALTWQNWFSLLPALAAVVATLALWSRNGKMIRLSRLLFIGPLWLIYDAYVGSISGVISQILSIGSILISIRRYGMKALDQIT